MEIGPLRIAGRRSTPLDEGVLKTAQNTSIPIIFLYEDVDTQLDLVDAQTLQV